MSVVSDPSAYRERTSAVDGVTVWTRVADGSSSWILQPCVSPLVWDRPSWVRPPMVFATSGRASPT